MVQFSIFVNECITRKTVLVAVFENRQSPSIAWSSVNHNFHFSFFLQTLYVSTTLGFWKDSPNLDVQGFNVYHKNRLIKVRNPKLSIFRTACCCLLEERCLDGTYSPCGLGYVYESDKRAS